MSFSSDLKEELSKISNLNKKDEVKYELIGYLISKNATVVKNSVRYATGSEYNINRFSKLLRNLNIDNDIEFDGKSTTFVESQKVPNDTKIVNYTWKYVNKNGNPDKRYKNNVRYPICEYANIYMKSKTGLNTVFLLSSLEKANKFYGVMTNINN